MDDHPKKVAVVTAAANGIGRATALMLARDNIHVIGIDQQEKVHETSREIERAGGTSTAFVADCRSRKAIEDVFAKIGAVDILVNGVGGGATHKTEFWCSDPETWSAVISLSLVSAMLCCRQVVPHMREARRGKIVNISSDAALRPLSTVVDYGAAKAGVIGFTRSLALELAPFGVNVNVVAPGVISTAANARSPNIAAEVARQSPMGILGEPDDIAHAVAFLASDRARYITGQTLAVNGGRHML